MDINNIKPGDTVCIVLYRYLRTVVIDTATVVKITPTGQITTDKGRYKKNIYTNWYQGIEPAKYFLEEATPDNLESLKLYKEQKEKELKEKSCIRKAKDFAHSYFYGHSLKSNDFIFAKKLIDLFENEE